MYSHIHTFIYSHIHTFIYSHMHTFIYSHMVNGGTRDVLIHECMSKYLKMLALTYTGPCVSNSGTRDVLIHMHILSSKEPPPPPPRGVFFFLFSIYKAPG